MKNKLAITSFILSLIGGIPLSILFIQGLTHSIPGIGTLVRFIVGVGFVAILSVCPFILLASLITSIISLILIKKHQLEGKNLALTSLIISSSFIILALGTFLYLISNPISIPFW